MERTEEFDVAERRVDLREGEEVVFEREDVVLTNLRLMAGWSNGHAKNVVLVKDIDGVRRIDGGQDSRLEPGLKVFAVGAVLAAIQVPIDTFLIAPSHVARGITIFNNLAFIAWAVGVGIGVYLILTSLIRVKPHTSLFFVRFGSKDIRVSFPGRNHADADELRSAFNRQKRALPF